MLIRPQINSIQSHGVFGFTMHSNNLWNCESPIVLSLANGWQFWENILWVYVYCSSFFIYRLLFDTKGNNMILNELCSYILSNVEYLKIYIIVILVVAVCLHGFDKSSFCNSFFLHYQTFWIAYTMGVPLVYNIAHCVDYSKKNEHWYFGFFSDTWLSNATYGVLVGVLWILGGWLLNWLDIADDLRESLNCVFRINRAEWSYS